MVLSSGSKRVIEVLFGDSLVDSALIHDLLDKIETFEERGKIRKNIEDQAIGILSSKVISRKQEIEKMSRAGEYPPVSQPDYRSVVNVAMMDIMGCIETPYLLQNERFPSAMVERYYTCHDEVFDGILKMLHESDNDVATREIFTDLVIKGDVDPSRLIGDERKWTNKETKIVGVMKDAVLEPNLRLFLIRDVLGYDESLLDYIRTIPDNVVGGFIGETIVTNLLALEENPDAEYTELPVYEQNLVENHYHKFDPDTIGKFSYSDFIDTRKALARRGDLALETSMSLLDDFKEIKEIMARNTMHCDVLDALSKDADIDKMYASLADSRKKELGC